MDRAKKNIAVVFGGRSCENEISVITGTMAANVIDGSAYNVYPVYLSQEGKFYTGEALFDVSAFRGGVEGKASEALFTDGALYVRKGKKLREISKIDCGVNCCHGMGGEDGAVSALFALNSIANASPDLLASSVFMDKGATKLVAKALGIRTAPYFRIGEREYARRAAFAVRCVEKRLGYPVIVKPARQGSSIGIFVAEDRASLVRALESAFSYDSVLIAEKYLSDRREINCAAYKKEGDIVVSECEEPLTSHKILTFGDKYISGGGKERSRVFPADVPAEIAARAKAYTKLLYRRLDLRGPVRADYIVSGGEVYFNEMNTVPGSLAYYLFSESLAGFARLMNDLIAQGIEDARVSQSKKMLKNCGVLNALPAKGGKAPRTR